MDGEAKLIDAVMTDPAAHFEPYDWHYRPDDPRWSDQSRRGLGDTQFGGGAVSG